MYEFEFMAGNDFCIFNNIDKYVKEREVDLGHSRYLASNIQKKQIHSLRVS